MRDDLIGYLLQALEPDERAEVEEELRDPETRRELELLNRGLDLLRPDQGHHDPPPGLADRTCQFVAQYGNVPSTAPDTFGVPARRWTMSDAVVAAGIFLAASALFFPAVSHSRFAARVAGCQNNLRQLGLALTEYSNQHNGYFPSIPHKGSLSLAGIYAPRLMESRFLPDRQALICPGSALAVQENLSLPTMRQLQQASGARLIALRRIVGGSYGYNLGYLTKDGVYHPTKNLRRARFAIMADAPSVNGRDHQSGNHDGYGQNVLFEDGHVAFMIECVAQGCRDKIYVNDENQVAAGTHHNDAVIGSSETRPVLTEVIVEELEQEQW